MLDMLDLFLFGNEEDVDRVVLAFLLKEVTAIAGVVTKLAKLRLIDDDGLISAEYRE
jgi:hypothetical protein